MFVGGYESMNIISLLAAGWSGYTWLAEYAWLKSLFSVLEPLLYAIMAVASAAGAIYAVILGINLARAEDQSKRDEAKKRIITTVIAVAVTIALVLFFNLLLPEILNSLGFTKNASSIVTPPATPADTQPNG